MTKAIFAAVSVSAALVCAAHPNDYKADVSTPEKKAAVQEALWRHDTSRDVVIWPADRLGEGAVENPYSFGDWELKEKNVIVVKMRNPQFTFFPADEAGARPCVVVFPGGGYRQLGWNKEGTEVAEWLNTIGFSAAVLLYRTDDRDGALADAQRTIGLLRRDAAKYNIDPKRVGVIGFSAGANLAVRTSTNWRKRIYERVDDADDQPCRPDFMMPIYPWDLRPKGPDGKWTGMKLDAKYPVDSETPPAFIAQSIDDFCQIETATSLDLALRRAGVASELHIYQNGGHGYGLRRLGRLTDTWSCEAVGWLARFADPVAR